ncbi:hypothetical protein FF36_03269 [Frankia torreyi]|uniref:Uncharacterized protein n=1 Tax=Frankia torreyi TaxID=1856 RepID=A0A0D8BG46_9ACTN|nr:MULTISPECIES: hypothetical protein [Frankia]KJE22397.1 hypothetical protein FF36_03269 [Frankia torreyi]KQC37405.1 hypothetical protein UK82_15470 [Frankia sp. ACN1ag]KQM05001.1 hypothetical protein FF86_102056 [Frankia sp. CpI1-P]
MTARFSGDVAFSVEDGSGPVGGRFEASGDRIRITTGQPGQLWSVAGDLLAALPAGVLPATVPAGRAGLRHVADVLAAEGMTVEIHGPAGPLVTIGADVDSRLGGLTVGSRRVEPSIPAALPGHPHATGRAAAVGFVAFAAFVAGFAARARLRHRPG